MIQSSKNKTGLNLKLLLVLHREERKKLSIVLEKYYSIKLSQIISYKHSKGDGIVEKHLKINAYVKST